MRFFIKGDSSSDKRPIAKMTANSSREIRRRNRMNADKADRADEKKGGWLAAGSRTAQEAWR